MTPPSTLPRSVQVALFLFILLAVSVILRLGQPVLVPIALAVLIAFVLHPLVKRVQRWGLPHVVAVPTVVGVAGLVVAAIGFVISSQVMSLADDLPNHQQNIETKVVEIRRWAQGGTVSRLTEMLERINRRTTAVMTNGETTPPGSDDPEPPTTATAASEEKIAQETDESLASLREMLMSPASLVVSSAFGAVGTFGIVIVLVIFFLLQQSDIRDRIVSLSGRGALATTTKALDDAGSRISRYLLMQFIINSTFGLAVTIGLLALQVPYAVAWGFFAFVLRYIPYVGPCIAVVLPVAVSLVTATGWVQPFLVIALFICLELLSNNVMEPVLYGQSVGLSEVSVILAAIFWAWMWGPIGLVLATPLTVCLVVLGKYVPGLKIFDQLLGERPPVRDSVRLYQRLLSKNEDDAEELVEEHLEENSTIATFDDLLLPTLEMMHTDHIRNQISDADVGIMSQILRSLVEEVSDTVESKIAKKKEAIPDREETTDDALDESQPLILGFPLRSDDEELALEMLGVVMTDLPCRFETIAEELLLSERIAEIAARSPSIVCVSTFPPGDLSYVRQVCKQLRAKLPQVKILVGRWAVQTRPKRDEPIRAAGADYVVGTMQEMHRQVQSLLSLHRATKPEVTDPSKKHATEESAA